MVKPLSQKNRAIRANPVKENGSVARARVRALQEMGLSLNEAIKLAELLETKSKHRRVRGAPSVHIPNSQQRKNALRRANGKHFPARRR